MPKIKLDLIAIAKQERELRDRLRELKKQQRAIARAEHDARLHRIAELVDQSGIAHISDTVLAAEFKRLATAHPSATEPADTADSVADDGEEARTRSAEPVAADAVPEPAAETARAPSDSIAEGDGKKRGFWR